MMRGQILSVKAQAQESVFFHVCVEAGEVPAARKAHAATGAGRDYAGSPGDGMLHRREVPSNRTAHPMTPDTPGTTPVRPAPDAGPPAPEGEAPFPVVGLGASAGGLEALPSSSGPCPPISAWPSCLCLTWIPCTRAAWPTSLGGRRGCPSARLLTAPRVEPDHVYVIPPNTSLTIEEGALRLAPRGHPVGPVMPVDHFLRSLAADRKAKAIGVILSGTGSDGTLGMQAVEAEGGITFAQDSSAKYEGMPRSAIDAGCVDFVRSPDGIARGVDSHQPAPVRQQRRRGRADGEAGGSTGGGTRSDPPPALSGTAEDDRTGLHPVQVRDAPPADPAADDSPSTGAVAGLRCLRDDPGELQALYQDMLINVTSFFRDPESFEALKTVVFPDLKDRDWATPIRVWVPGMRQRRGGVLPGHLPARIPWRRGRGTVDQALRHGRE